MDWPNIIGLIVAIIAALAAVVQAYMAIKATPAQPKNLRRLLANKRWGEADEETTRILLKMANQEEKGWLDTVDFKGIQCEDLINIDRLWVKYSGGHFGFSVQKRIWEDVGGYSHATYEIRKQFGDRVGWRINGEWKERRDETTGNFKIDKIKLIFNKAAPKGHLPLGVSEGFNQEAYKHPLERQTIFTRLNECKSNGIVKQIPVNFIALLIIIGAIIYRFYLTEPIDPTALSTPTPRSPLDGTIFDHFPRQTILTWNMVPGAKTYTVELDCFHCCESGKWCTEVGQEYQVVPGLKTNRFTFNFVGAQPGRWRVWAVGANGREGPKSEWLEFRYTR